MKVILLQDVKALGKKDRQWMSVTDMQEIVFSLRNSELKQHPKTLMTLNYRRHMKKRLLKSSLKKPRLCSKNGGHGSNCFY